MPSMSDYVKKTPQKALSDTAKSQWDLDTSPADIPADIIEWRQKHKERKEENQSSQKSTPEKSPSTVVIAPPKATDSQVDTQDNAQPTLAVLDANKLTTNLQQTSNKVTTKLQQTPNKVTTKKDTKRETYNKLTTEPTTLSTTKLQQTYNKVTTNAGVMSLVGLQSKIVQWFYKICRMKGQKITDPVSIQIIAHSCETTARSAQETIRRIEKKGFLKRVSFKNGRSGWTVYELPDAVYGDLFKLESYNKPTTKLQQTPNKVTTEPTTELTTSPPCSSSSNIFNNTTTTEEGTPAEEIKDNLIFENWGGLNPASLVKYVYQEGTWNHSIQELQEILDKAAAAVEHSKQTKKPISSPLGFLHSCLAKWSVDAPPGYESRQERALKLRLEEEKKKLENLKRLKEELAITRFKSFVAKQKPELIKDLRAAAKEAGESASFGGKRLERHRYISSLVDLFFENEIVEGVTKEALLNVPDLI